MEKKYIFIILSIIIILSSALTVVIIVNAATSLTPPGSPAGTMRTLDDVYNSMSTSLTWQPVVSVISLPWNANNCGSEPNNCSDPKGDASLYLGATEFCVYLNTAGTAVNCSGDPLVCSPVNYWRLPTESELLASLSDQYVISPAVQTGFQDGYNYWSSTPFAGYPGYAWGAFSGVGGVNSYGYFIMTNQYLVRCVH